MLNWENAVYSCADHKSLTMLFDTATDAWNLLGDDVKRFVGPPGSKAVIVGHP